MNTMKHIYGLDFTSAPSRKKPLVLAHCTLTDDRLRLEDIETFLTFKGFEAFLARDGEWVAGLDFAFGQPRKLIDNLNWPSDWSGYVGQVAALTKKEWVGLIDDYMANRPKGDKLHFRHTDRLTRAQSPMQMYFIPVGRMFYEGARRLLDSDVSVLPCRPADPKRVVLEVYPALAVRDVIGRGSGYKSDNPAEQSPNSDQTRRAIVDAVCAHAPVAYGLTLELPPTLRNQLTADASGDTLDAWLAAVQAAWASRQPDYSISPDADKNEGWIINPQATGA